MSESEDCCGNCLYFHQFNGECHRHAPTSLPAYLYGIAVALTRAEPEALDIVDGAETAKTGAPTEIMSQPVWPMVKEDDWCGEWAAA